MRIILEEVTKKQSDLYKRGKFKEFLFRVKIIYCAPCSISVSIINREIADYIKLKREFLSLVCGFDLIGAEDCPVEKLKATVPVGVFPEADLN